MPDEGRRIREFREEREMSLSELAARSGLSKSYLWNLENKPEDKRPSAKTLYAIAEALGVTMSDLLGRRLLSAAQPQEPDLELLKFAEQEGISESDVQMLASVQWRGDRPKTAERWRYIYHAIRMSRDLDRPRRGPKSV